MPTNLDSLQIEIVSSSARAVGSIRDLAGALGELKSNSKITSAVNNLNNLRKSLHSFANIPSNASKIISLAQSMERLKTVGSVTSIGNSLTKLATSLSTLNKVQVDQGKIDSIASALGSLSAVKAGGINTMMNGLAKLGKVTASLDDDTIDAFAERIEKLTEKLTPLSTKMTTIQAGLKGINTSARSAGKGVKEMGDELDTSSINLSSFIHILQNAVQWLQQAIEKFSAFVADAVEWDGIAARFGRGFGDQAQETYEWIQRLNEEMGINIQQFMKYSSVYSTMLTGFGVANEDAVKMALGYTELTYDIWAGYNDIYKNFDDAAEAVKSAIAGEVEPIRRAGFTIVESTLEQTAANHGLNISIEKATEAQKSYLRYLTLVDQAHAQGLVGTYAKELETAEGLLRTLAQQVKSLAQAFGSLFLPILTKVLPYIQAFVELLTEAVHWVARLFGIKIQAVDWSGYGDGIGGVADSAEDATDSLGSAAKAAKELKNATLGIDELNVISPPTESGGSGGVGGGGAGFDGLDVDSLWDESIFESIGSKVDEIKEKMKDWLGVTDGIDSWADFFESKLGKILTAVGLVGAAFAGWKIASSVITFLDKIENIKSSESFTKILPTLKQIGKWLLVVAGVLTTAEASADSWEDGVDWSNLGQQALGNGMAIGGGFLLGPMFGGVASIIVGIIDLMGSLKSAIADGNEEWSNTLSIVMGISAIGGGISVLMGSWIPVAVAGVVATLAVIAIYADDIWAGIKKFFGEILPKFVMETVPNAFISAWEAVKNFFAETLPAWVNDIGYAIGYGLGRATRSIVDWWQNDVVPFFTKTVPAFFTETVPQFFVAAWEWIKQFVTVTVPNFFSVELPKIFAGIAEFFSELWPRMKEIGLYLIQGLWQGVKDAWNWLVNLVKGFCSNFVQGWKDGFGVNSPSTVFAEIGTWLVKGLWEGIKGAYNWIVGLVGGWVKDLLASITSKMSPNAIRDKISTMWTTAKNWWNDKKGALKTYTPSIGSIYEKVKERWDNARTWWNEKKSAMKQYTPSIGSIYEKVYDRWKNARDWWNSKKGSMSYTPSIGSITDKLKSAWNSAKSWWNKNVKLSTKLNVQVPTIKVKWETASAFGKSFKYPTGFSLKFAADGGIFDAGSLIWAGERGPEILANAGGGKTGVMNVQQMQDAVYEGVYAAVVAAMRASGGSGQQGVNVYLDGRQITATVEQRQRERGASIMGTQVYSY